MPDAITFEEKTYPVRKAAIECYESEVMISTEELESMLINTDGGYISTEARLVDEQFFFYVPESIIMECSDEEVVKFIRRNLDATNSETGGSWK